MRDEAGHKPLTVDPQGFVAGARYLPSPNCDERPADFAVELIVIHNISLPPGQFGGDAVMDLFLNRLDAAAHPFFATIAHLRVSAHFLIRRDGELIQFVSCGQRAWHAGVSNWRGRERCNDFSIGIELEGADDIPFTEVQYEMLSRLVRALLQCYPGAELTGHSDIAPGRKTDPGPHFDWPRLRALLNS